MFSFLKNKKGSALLGVLLAILTIAALIYGSSFFWQKDIADPGSNREIANNNKAELYKQAIDDIEKINQDTENKNREISTDNIISVNDIKDGDPVASPLMISGTISEAIPFVTVELRNKEREPLVKETVVVKKSDEHEEWTFAVTLYFQFNSTREGYVAVYSDNGGLIEIPVNFDN